MLRRNFLEPLSSRYSQFPQFTLDETHLDAVTGLILLRDFRSQYLVIVAWQQKGHLALKTASNTNRFMLYQSKDNASSTQKPRSVS